MSLIFPLSIEKKKKKNSIKIPSSHSKNWVPKKLLIIYCFVNAIFEKVIKTELFSNHKTCRKKNENAIYQLMQERF